MFRPPQQWQNSQNYAQVGVSRRRNGGAIRDSVTLRALKDRRDFSFPVSLFLRNARPIGHHVRFLDHAEEGCSLSSSKSWWFHFWAFHLAQSLLMRQINREV
jgi:hypothetical protein